MAFLRLRRRQPGPDPFLTEPVTRYTGPRFPDPHGIATDETLAGIAAQAEAETAQAATATWRAAEPITDIYTWYGWGDTAPDNPPAHDRPYVPVPVPPPAPYSGISAVWVDRIAYPDLNGTPEEYAETMRHIGVATGTSSWWEQPSAWPRHCIEAGSGVAA